MKKHIIGSLVALVLLGVYVTMILLPALTEAQIAAGTVNIGRLPFSQGSTTSGQTGNLIMGAVTTSAPSYTTAQTSPLSLTTAGLLRVDWAGTVGHGTYFNGQASVTGTAAALAANTAKEFCVKALTANTVAVYVGISTVTTSTGQELSPGDVRCYHLNNTNLVYAIAVSGTQTVAFDGEN